LCFLGWFPEGFLVEKFEGIRFFGFAHLSVVFTGSHS